MAERSVNIRLSLKDGEIVKRALLSLGEEGERALKRIQSAGVPASHSLLALDTAVKEAKISVSSWAAEAGAAGRVLTAFGPGGLAAAAGIGVVTLGLFKLVDAAKAAAADLDHLQDTSDRLGVHPDFLQAIRFAAGQMGADVEKVDTALDTLNQRLGDVARGGGEAAKKALERLGVSLTDGAGHVKTLQQILPDLADGFAQVQSAQERASLAQELFGRGNQAFARILVDGSAALRQQMQIAREMGAVLDNDLVRKGAAAHDKLEALSQVIQTQLRGALVAAIPAITAFALEISKIAVALGALFDARRPLGEQLTSTLTGTLDKLRAEQVSLAELQKQAIAGENEGILPEILARRQANLARIAAVEAAIRANRDQTPIVQGAPITDDGKTKAASDALKDHSERVLEDVEAQEKLIAAEMKAGALYDSLIRAGVARGDALRAEAAALQAAHTQEEIHNRLKAAGVKEDSTAGQAIVAEVTALGNLKLALEETNHARQEATQIIEATRTREEEYAGKLAELNYLLRQGAIDQDTYNRAVAKYSPMGQMAQEAIDASRDSLRQFVLDADRAALAGGDFWASFAQAGITALTSLQEKLLGLMLDLAIGKQGDTGFGFLGQLFGGLLGGTPATPAGSPTYGGPRAEGGDVWPGRFYRVNERGPEYFAPSIAGRIFPAGPTAQPNVNLIVNNQGADVQQGSTRRRANGDIDVELMVRNVVRDEMASPRGQDLASRTYNIPRQTIRRGQ